MEDVVQRKNEGRKAQGAMKCVPSNIKLGLNAKKCLHEGVLVSTMLLVQKPEV